MASVVAVAMALLLALATLLASGTQAPVAQAAVAAFAVLLIVALVLTGLNLIRAGNAAANTCRLNLDSDLAGR